MLTSQVQAISSAKRESLTTEQQDAIRSVIASDPDEEDPWGPDEEDPWGPDDDRQGRSLCSGEGTVGVTIFWNAVP